MFIVGIVQENDTINELKEKEYKANHESVEQANSLNQLLDSVKKKIEKTKLAWYVYSIQER